MTISKLKGFGTVDNLTPEERDELVKLESLANIPKVRFSTRPAVTVYPSDPRSKKKVYAHIEIYKNVENVANTLRSAGVRPGTVLGIVMPNSLAGIIYFLATQWIGAIAAPVDPALSEDELVATLGELKPLSVVSPLVDSNRAESDELYTKVMRATVTLKIKNWHLYQTINEGVMLEIHGLRAADSAAWAGGSADFKLDPEEVCLRLKSSSESPPLVLPLSSRNVTAACKSFKTTYELSPGNTTVIATPLCTMQGILVICSCFYSGGHVVIPPAGEFDASLFWKMTKEDNVTWISSSTKDVLDLYEKTIANPPTSSTLTFVRAVAAAGGTSTIPIEDLAKIEDTLKAPILESYGPPEASGLATANREFDFRPGTLGLAVTGCKVVILDPDTKERLPDGQTGDIFLCGENITEGYLNNPTINEDSKVTLDEEDWFCVGDRGQIDPEGYLKVLGSSRAERALTLEERQNEAAAAAEAAVAAAAAAAAAEEAAAAAAAQEAEDAARLAEAKRKEDEERQVREEEERQHREAELAAQEARDKEAEAQRLREQEMRAQKEEQELAAQREIQAREAAMMASAAHQASNDAILSKLAEIEGNQRRLEEEISLRHRNELQEMEERIALIEAEKMEVAAAEAAARDEAGAPILMEVQMDAMESAAMAAASSAEEATTSTRRAMEASTFSSKHAADSADAASAAAKAAAEAAAAAGDATLIAKNMAEKASIFEAPSYTDPDAVKKSLNISLADVDNSLKTHPAVAEARSFGKPDEKYGTEIYCAVQPRKGARLSEAWLKLHAQSVLPAMMVPKKFYLVDSLPKDRKELALCDDIIATYGKPNVAKPRSVKAPRWKAT
mmetsp:Transcript_9434/g.19316  ORF Transcript_9434/g.19316 Transcript_9434/m.19316 type:complete len:847 (-) Transcript_9434:520-3060(-)|eukprot:CAMPEP_0184681898 /NCGR_PEP_ID=MMETSP0312-20130426/4887_1 /TAXON_ID=31354 /ORGANISM="Compsopogon coeruleus, Strain SAG 36.94" /LENGTH=846 /DNA_ID=CAMNT_0027133033 /DNA_START=58 /DNA_END=2598 /DNA_ORIENTATION=-